MQLSPAGMTSCTPQGHRRSKDEQATFRVVALNGRNRIGHIELHICHKHEPEAGKAVQEQMGHRDILQDDQQVPG
ncbi:MAG: hypothetical protein QXY02_03300 [Conexivisphaerales archaeon]